MNTDIAYLSGIIDGEGWIGIERRGPFGHEKTVRFVFRIIVTNNDPDLMTWLTDHFGGVVRRHGLGWQWSIDQAHALKIIAQCAEYLVVKKRHAEIAAEFRKLRVVAPRLGTPQSMVDRRAQLRSEMQAATQRLRNPGTMRKVVSA